MIRMWDVMKLFGILATILSFDKRYQLLDLGGDERITGQKLGEEQTCTKTHAQTCQPIIRCNERTTLGSCSPHLLA